MKKHGPRLPKEGYDNGDLSYDHDLGGGGMGNFMSMDREIAAERSKRDRKEGIDTNQKKKIRSTSSNAELHRSDAKIMQKYRQGKRDLSERVERLEETNAALMRKVEELLERLDDRSEE